MIAQLSGELTAVGDRWIIIDVHGVGYRVQVTQPAIRQLNGSRGEVRVFTYMAVREDAITLYGFLHPSELEMFRILIGVTGIGPQTSMNLLSQIGIEELAMAVLNEDEKALVRISGIGAKGAKRLILELRDKMKKIGETLPKGDGGAVGMAVNDAVSALVSLGFAENSSRDAVIAAARTCGSSPDVQDLIKAALVRLKE